jgi:NDP-sugar pyrophosphorylase family protein
VINGDSYCDADLARFWDDHVESRTAASMLLSHVPDSSRFGAVQLAQGGLISAFQEKTTCAGPGWINAGIYIVTRDWLNAIPAVVPCSLEREVFPAWIQNGIRGVKTEGHFMDIGTPESHAEANRWFRERATPSFETPVSQTATIRRAR